MNESLEQAVRRRAKNRCEYCQIPAYISEFTFPVDHIVAQQHRGGPFPAVGRSGKNLKKISAALWPLVQTSGGLHRFAGVRGDALWAALLPGPVRREDRLAVVVGSMLSDSTRRRCRPDSEEFAPSRAPQSESGELILACILVRSDRSLVRVPRSQLAA